MEGGSATGSFRATADHVGNNLNIKSGGQDSGVAAGSINKGVTGSINVNSKPVTNTSESPTEVIPTQVNATSSAPTKVDGIRFQKPKVSYYYRPVTKPKNGGASTSKPSVQSNTGSPTVNASSTCNEPTTNPTSSTAPPRDNKDINLVDLKNSFDALKEKDSILEPIASIAYVAEATYNSEPASVDPHNNTFEREHKTYASLLLACTSFQLDSCLGYPASASSTNNYPKESFINTMNLTQKCLDRYWSSKGHDDPEVLETLIYYLDGTICVITEIDITPFQVGNRIYSAMFVRFRPGHPKSQKDIGLNFIKAQECADDKFVWTYTSETFPMVQVN
ncbi:F-box domain-containing protein [Artemisia annua]|uniref:F-box domain-containing protein n=1 Tax=Artemisia annua TaxID=35608 RepID=A0A2U1PGL8_ARTAN|nr:F-box domain-containing protein [Artemisia annua]